MHEQRELTKEGLDLYFCSHCDRYWFIKILSLSCEPPLRGKQTPQALLKTRLINDGLEETSEIKNLMNLICDDCLLECPDAIYAELCPLVQMELNGKGP